MAEQYKIEPHNFNLRAGSYHWCSKCGLVAFKNDFSQWAIRQGCNHKDHPSYQNKLSITNPFK